MRKHWLRVAVGLLTAMLALGAVACGDDDKDGNGAAAPTATEAASTAATPTEAAGETPADGEPTSAPGAFTTVVATEDPALGTILTTYDGYTVYTFDNDSEGVSTCTGDCATTWPPLPTAGEPTGGAGVTGTLDTITRDDGSTQVTYDGAPLHLYSGDAAPGDTNGDGIGGLWHVVSLD